MITFSQNSCRLLMVHIDDNTPRSICDECVLILGNISLFLDISKFNGNELVENVEAKNEIQTTGSLIPQEQEAPVVEKYKLSRSFSQDCRICSSPGSLTPFNKRKQLMLLYQDITNIHVEGEIKSGNEFLICRACTEELEKISSFIDLSLCNDDRIGRAIRRTEFMKSGGSSELIENAIFTSTQEEGEGGLEDKRVVHEIEGKHEVIDIKKETIGSDYEIKENHEVIDIEEEKNENNTEAASHTDHKSCTVEVFRSKDGQERSRKKQEHLPIHIDKKAYECNSCKKIFRFSTYSKHHIHTQTEGKHLKCYNCFLKKGQCRRQSSTESKESRKSPICDKNTVSKSVMKLYEQKHAKEKLFECGYCGKSFIHKSKLKRHSLSHTREKLIRCDFCDESFSLQSHLKRHMTTHTGKKVFACDCCGKSYAYKSLWKRHSVTHTSEKSFTCYNCNGAFASKGQLRMHLLTHTGGKRFKCDLCDKTFTQSSTLRSHILIHSGERPFKCDRCDKSFTQKVGLKNHLLSHTGEKPFKCHCCDRNFSQKWHLKRHLLTHTGEKLFKCNGCDKSFTQKAGLKNHSLSHTGEKPFKCHCCDRNFSQKCHLKRHLLTHTGEKLFKCNGCDKSFSQKDNLKKHSLLHT